MRKGETDMKGDKIVRQLRMKLAGDGKNIMLGRIFVQHVMDAMEELQKQNRQLKDAMDAGNRELAQIKAENERLNRENFWMSKGGAKYEQ